MAILEPIAVSPSGKTQYRVLNPATLEYLYTIECADRLGVAAAVARARAAQEHWAALPLALRGASSRAQSPSTTSVSSPVVGKYRGRDGGSSAASV